VAVGYDCRVNGTLLGTVLGGDTSTSPPAA
jgi:hypothetical protein